ncbi:MAG: hypothetical protein IJB75_04220 [Oscillospiraceae bacterium]|nr:hypothetical protein [Oscillospiraceae bacterium]
MYNRYIPASQQPQPDGTRTKQSYSESGWKSRLGQPWFQQLSQSLHLFGGASKNAGIAGILKGFGLDDLDSGDVLLLLILLLVFLEGDNTELVITLGLMLLLEGTEDQNE